MPDRTLQLRWVTIENEAIMASAPVRDGDVLRLVVAVQPEGKWDWLVWHTLRGDDCRFGVAPTASSAVEAAAVAAEELANQLASAKLADVPGTSWPERRRADASASPPALYPASISDRVLSAFHMACDQSDLPVATALLRILDSLAKKRTMPESARKLRTMEQLVAAHVRRWHLIHSRES